MNYKQYLYSKAAEEASEIAQAAIKTQLFGEYSTDPRETTGETNITKLVKEISDLHTVLALLDEVLIIEGVILNEEFNHDKHMARKAVTLKQNWSIVEELQ